MHSGDETNGNDTTTHGPGFCGGTDDASGGDDVFETGYSQEAPHEEEDNEAPRYAVAIRIYKTAPDYFAWAAKKGQRRREANDETRSSG